MADPIDDLNLPGVGAWATFAYYFTCTTWLVAWVAAQGLHLHLSAPEPYRYGILLGLPVGLIGVYFNRTVVWQTSIDQPQRFQARLDQALADMGFQLQADSPAATYRVYTRPAFGNLLAQRIRVQLQAEQAAIAGRAAQVKQLQQKL